MGLRSGAVTRTQCGSDFGKGPRSETDGRRGLPLLGSSARGKA